MKPGHYKTFSDCFRSFDAQKVSGLISQASSSEVQRALSKAGHCSVEDLAALLSPAAEPFLEAMASEANRLTRKRFGKTIQMFVPMYLSNECQNICTYCGFSLGNKIPRITLNKEQFLNEIEAVKKWGFEHILLVTGESHLVGMEYFLEMIPLARQHFAHVSIEVQPLEEKDYQKLHAAGVESVLVYQETYSEEAYSAHHTKGKKANFFNRLETPEKIARAGINKIGLGSLLGLSDWRTDAWFAGLHLVYMREKYWRSRYSLAFPRLQPAEGIVDPAVITTEKNLAQLICAYRLLDETVELSLSTRESERFRNHAIQLGVTTMSAGSRTDPGGYQTTETELEQFEISDERNPDEVANMLVKAGLEPVWKDWDQVISG